MKTTTNYGLKKPEGNEYISIDDLNYNADLIDEELKKRAKSSGGDISDTIVKSFGTCEEEFPVPEPGEDSKTLWGKVKKFAGDMKDWMTGVCLLGHIVNNCVTDRADLPLSAAQGKVLMDLYTVLNTKTKWKLHYSNQNVPNDIVLDLPEIWSEIQLLEFSNENATSGVIKISKEAFDILPIGKFVSTGYYLSQSDNAAIAFGKVSATSIRTRTVRTVDTHKQSSLYIYYR